MATITREIRLHLHPDEVWDAVRDYGAVHRRLAPGFVVDTRLEDGARVVTFGNGAVVRELIVAVDDGARRLVWAVVGTALTHHNASMQVHDAGGDGSRVVWIADLLPDEAAPRIAGLIEQGLTTMQATLEQTAPAAR